MRKINYFEKMIGSDGKEFTVAQKICLETFGCIKFKTCSWEVYEKGILKAIEVGKMIKEKETNKK